MKRKNMSRSALLTSVISLLLCVSMLVGTTFAWFSESVVSDRNVIAAGNLDVELYHSNRGVTDEPVDGSKVLFGDIELWEPGAVVYENLTVENVGSLALQYSMTLNVLDETSIVVGDVKYKLSDAIKVGVVPGGVTVTGNDRAYVLEQVKAWTNLSGFNFSQEAAALVAGDSECVGVVLYWAPISNEFDNIFNMKNDKRGEELTLEIGVNLVATQYVKEYDSFDDKYDKEVAITIKTTDKARSDGSVSLTVLDAPSLFSKMTTVEAMPGTYAPDTTVELQYGAQNDLHLVLEDGQRVATMVFNVTTPNGEGYPKFKVSTYISMGLSIADIVYVDENGNEETFNFDYDPVTGKLTYETTHFSTYCVKTNQAYAYNDQKDIAYSTADRAADAIEAEIEAYLDSDVDKENVSFYSNIVVAPEKVAEVAAKFDNNDDVNNVVKDTFVENYAVAEVNGVYYLTFKEALEAVQAGQTITLKNNAYLNKAMTVPSGNITLDLGGNVLDASAMGLDRPFYLSNGSNFTINANGGAVVMGQHGLVNVQNVSSTTVTLNGGVYSGKLANGALIRLKAGVDEAHVTLNDVIFMDAVHDGYVVSTNGFDGTGTLEVNGGSFDAKYGFEVCKLTANISDATIKTQGNAIDANKNSNVTVDGCSITTDNLQVGKAPCAGAAACNYGSLTVKNCTFNGEMGAVYHVYTSGGYIVAENNVINATYTKLTQNDAPIENNEGMITVDGIQFVATAEGLKAAIANGGEITLNGNIDIGGTTLTVAKETILDLNGYVLHGTCNAYQGHLFKVNNNAALTILDSSTTQSGKIVYAQGSSGTGWAIAVDGMLNLCSGTIELTGDSWSIGYCVDLRPNAWGSNFTEDSVFYMNGGKLISSDGAIRVASSSDDAYANIVASFIMNGGDINANWDGIFVQQSNNQYDTLNVTINDGTVISKLAPIRVYGPAPASVNAGTEKPITIAVNGGSLAMSDTPDASKTWHTESKIMFGGGITLEQLNQYANITVN